MLAGLLKKETKQEAMRAHKENATIYVTITINIVIHIYELAIRRRLSSPSFRPAVLRIAFPQPASSY